jgi:hypothetical protein
MISCYVQKIRRSHAVNAQAECLTTPLALIPAIEETAAAARKGNFFHRTDVPVRSGIPGSWIWISREAGGRMPVSISAAETTSGLNLPIQDGWNGRSFIAAVPSGNRAGAPSKAFPEKIVFLCEDSKWGGKLSLPCFGILGRLSP